MNTAVRLSVFGLALAVVFGGGWAIGRVIGPDGASAASSEATNAGHGGAEHGDTGPNAGDAGHSDAGHSGTGNNAGHSDAGPDAGHADAGHGDAGHGAAASASDALPGLASTQHGYTFAPQNTRLDAGAPADFRFRIVDGSSAPVTRFAVEHDKLLHLVVVRRDGAHYQHLHPELAADGTWSVPLTLPAAGSYRMFADFRPDGGEKTTLGVDVQAAGDYRPQAPAGEQRTSTVDGYTVTLEGPLTAGASATVTASVTSGGQPVTDLQPYLGAYGHLVALRDGDLAYLHVHPDGVPGDGRTSAGPRVTFAVQVPTAGRYLLFLDFQHGGVVRTASFVLEASR